jgi:hypothetical protein
MRVSLNQQNLSFRAVPLAQWRCKTLNNKTKNITIVAFEKKDLKFVGKFIEKSDIICSRDSLKQKLVSDTIRTIRDSLNITSKSFEKVKMFMAIHEGTPCGLLVGNIPKKNIDTEQIKYSSRHNPAKNETELDWLVTWRPRGKSKIKGIGKALVGEYFRTVKKDKFRDVFVRSEVPENSYAKDFYESLGFEQMSDKRLKLFNKNSAQYIISDYGDGSDDTIPMIITRKTLQETATHLSEKMMRQEFKRKSVDADDLIKI